MKLFTFRFSPTLGAFDETPLAEFIRDKDMIAFREHFFVVSDVPHIACVVTYQDAVVPPEPLAAAREVAATPSERGCAPSPRHRWSQDRGREARPDPAAGFYDTGRALFNTAREWRANTARTEGVPPYVILTNRELARIVQARPESLTALGNIENIGPGKVDRYGVAILKVLHGTPAAKNVAIASAAAGPVTPLVAAPTEPVTAAAITL